MNGIASGALPDGRTYEQVSPPPKNAADIIPNLQRVRASADGNAVQFASLTGFGDVRGGSVSTDYLALRDPQSGTWSSHGITPVQEPGAITDASPYALEPRYVGEFSPDLGSGVFLAKSPLTIAPNVATIPNLYLRTDLRSPGSGHYELLTNASSAQEGAPTFILQPYMVAASADFGTIVFQTQRNLTPEAETLPGPSASCLPSGSDCGTGVPKVYKWAFGTLHLVGILPNGMPTISQAGQGAGPEHRSYALGVLSDDGSRVIFTAPPFDADQRGGDLYIRDDRGTEESGDDSTVQVNASERTDCSNDPTCGGNGIPDADPDTPQPARYWAASSNGAVVFFTSDEVLTDVPSGGLYRFDLEAPPGQRLTLLSVDHEPADGTSSGVAGVFGTSRNGDSVYFAVVQNQIIAGGRTDPVGPEGDGARIFLWSGGTVREVGGVRAGDELDINLGNTGWGFSPKSSRVTPDGTYLMFTTRGTGELLTLYGKPHEYDNGSCDATGCQEVYVYNAGANGGSGDLQCASCNPTGTAATGNAEFAPVIAGVGASRDSSHLSHFLSDDGRFVFFNSPDRLQQEDENDAIDGYEFDTASGRVHLISSGRGPDDALVLDASANGSDVFFTTRERLRSSDVDQSRDLYDARIGGVPDPGVTTQKSCNADECRPTRRPALAVVLPSSNRSRPHGNGVERRGPAAAFVLDSLNNAQRRALARTGKARLRISATRRGTIRIRIWARLHGKRRSLASLTRVLSRGGETRVPVRLSRAARRQLHQRHRLRLSVVATYSQVPTAQRIEIVLRGG